MTKIEKRIGVLEDAIQQVENGSFLMGRGRGFSFPISEVNWKKYNKQEFQSFLLKPGNQCSVCAKGALLVSTVRKFDSCSGEFFLELTARFCTTKNVLTKLFGQKTLDRMEVLFEGRIFSWTHKHYQEETLNGRKLLEQSRFLPNDFAEKAIAIFKAELATEKAKLAVSGRTENDNF